MSEKQKSQPVILATEQGYFDVTKTPPERWYPQNEGASSNAASPEVCAATIKEIEESLKIAEEQTSYEGRTISVEQARYLLDFTARRLRTDSYLLTRITAYLANNDSLTPEQVSDLFRDCRRALAAEELT